MWGGKNKYFPKVLPTSATVDESMVQWDPTMVHKLKKLKSLLFSKLLSLTQSMPLSGVFNICFPCAPLGHKKKVLLSLPGIVGRFSVVTIVFCRKFNMLEKTENQDIVCLQETKGTQSLINKHFRKLSRDFWIVPNLSAHSVNESYR